MDSFPFLFIDINMRTNQMEEDEEIGSMLDLQSLEASSDAIDPRASGASFMCNGDNSSVSLWCG